MTAEKPFIIDNMANSCRVCLQNCADMFPLFNSSNSPEYGLKLMKCAGIQVSENDGLPIAICGSCILELSQAYKFVMKCRESDERLRKVLEENTTKEKDKDHIRLTELEFSIKEEPTYEDLSHSEDNMDLLPLSQFKSECDDDSFISIYKHRKYKDRSKKKSKMEKKLKRNISSIGIIQCAICGLVVKSRAAMIAHTRTHTGERPFQCPDCPKRFRDKGTLKGHCRRFHSNIGRTFTCDACGGQFYRKKDMVVHMRRHTGETPYHCTYCPRSFSQQSTLIRHTRTHTGEKPFSCHICNKTFAGRTTLKKHMLVHTDERKFSCNICGKCVKSKDALIKHEFLHQHLKPHICDQCAMAFTTKGNLKLHMGKVHSDRSGICSVCNKRFSNLENHTRKHTGETPFQCHICSRCFMQKGSLNIHMTKHDNAEKYPCLVEDCPRKFPAPSMLEFHVLKHHKNQTPHVCPKCERGFFRNCDLTRHLKTNHSFKKKLSSPPPLIPL